MIATGAAGAIMRGRLAAESLMVNTCTIERKTGSTMDPTTGNQVDTWSTVYSGKCRVQQYGEMNTGAPAQAGNRTVEVRTWELAVPVTVTGVAIDDRATITASALDPELPGRMFRVTDLYYKTHATARRLSVEDVSAT